MKLIHLSDLHIGKRLNDFSLIDDQKYILDKIVNIIDEEKPQAVLIAGDVYDKSVPSAEAVELFDNFLESIAKNDRQIFVISGNHDSAERIAFGSSLMKKSGVHMSRVFDGRKDMTRLEDEFGFVDVYMLPFIKPAYVRSIFEDENIENYEDAVKCAIDSMVIDKSVRNIIVAHQFITGASVSESEEISVGGSENVGCGVFDDFDYVALGHIHKPQYINREQVRYCGTPLAYSFSECGHEKSVTVVEMGRKGEVFITERTLEPVRHMREMRGSFDEIINCEKSDDYIHVILTDEDDVINAVGRLRNVFPNMMKLDYDNSRTKSIGHIDLCDDVDKKSNEELFEEFYLKQNGKPMNNEQRKIVEELFAIAEEERI